VLSSGALQDAAHSPRRAHSAAGRLSSAGERTTSAATRPQPDSRASALACAIGDAAAWQ
jgi:hypothetical protein